MEKQKDIRLLLITWYEGVVSISERITSGNLSHQKPALKGFMLRAAEYLFKNHSDDTLAIKHANTFLSLANKCDRLTTGNLTHDNAIIRGVARNYVSLFKDIIKLENGNN